MTLRPAVLATIVVAAATMLAACGSSRATIDELTVAGVWARPTPAGAANGVVYLRITSPIDDTLLRAAVSASVADAATIHRSAGGDGASGHEGHGGAGGDDMATMTEANAVELSAGEPVAFEPGGLHVMLTDLVAPLVEGETFDLVLGLDHGGDVTVTVVVAVNPP